MAFAELIEAFVIGGINLYRVGRDLPPIRRLNSPVKIEVIMLISQVLQPRCLCQ